MSLTWLKPTLMQPCRSLLASSLASLALPSCSRDIRCYHQNAVYSTAGEETKKAAVGKKDEKSPKEPGYSDEAPKVERMEPEPDALLGSRKVRNRAWRTAVSGSQIDLLLYNALEQWEKDAYLTHLKATVGKELWYTDPSTGRQVATRLQHVLRGVCCGCACRHCPFQHRKAPDALRQQRRFNGAFYV